jgi:NADP-dependent 3-hydroxy acid dehydrogenase YdfG
MEMNGYMDGKVALVTIEQFYKHYALPASSLARAVAFAISKPEDVDINEILFRPTRQEL